MKDDEKEPLVSVVMPCYAGSTPAHVREAVESILSQSYQPIELLAVLDGPVPAEIDGFLRALEEAGRLRLLEVPENRGPAHARNLAIAEARGAYIALLDADDVAEPRRIACQVAFLEARGADVVGSDYRLIDETGKVLSERRMPRDMATIRRWAWMLNPMANSTVLARAEVLKTHPFNEAYRYGEDYCLWVSLLRAGKRLENQPEFLVRFRISGEFYARRRGLHRFRTDWANKLRTLPLYPLWLRPCVLLLITSLVSLRLIPARLLAPVYRLRDRLRFVPKS